MALTWLPIFATTLGLVVSADEEPRSRCRRPTVRGLTTRPDELRGDRRRRRRVRSRCGRCWPGFRECDVRAAPRCRRSGRGGRRRCVRRSRLFPRRVVRLGLLVGRYRVRRSHDAVVGRRRAGPKTLVSRRYALQLGRTLDRGSLHDRVVEGVVAVAGDHVAGAGDVDELRVRAPARAAPARPSSLSRSLIRPRTRSVGIVSFLAARCETVAVDERGTGLVGRAEPPAHEPRIPVPHPAAVGPLAQVLLQARRDSSGGVGAGCTRRSRRRPLRATRTRRGSPS